MLLRKVLTCLREGDIARREPYITLSQLSCLHTTVFFFLSGFSKKLEPFVLSLTGRSSKCSGRSDAGPNTIYPLVRLVFSNSL